MGEDSAPLLSVVEVSKTFGGIAAVSGVSLTVNAGDQQEFEVNLIPHTLAMTTLSGLAVGDRINLEVDLGSAASMSLVYNLIIVATCWVFYTVMTQLDRRRDV